MNEYKELRVRKKGFEWYRLLPKKQKILWRKRVNEIGRELNIKDYKQMCLNRTTRAFTFVTYSHSENNNLEAEYVQTIIKTLLRNE